MNCKRDQLAWIVVPREYYGTGIEQLNNRVVKTIELLPGRAQPTWHISPKQVVRFTRPVRDFSGRDIEPGEDKYTVDILDAWLRPFDPNSEPLNEPAARELETTQ